MKTISLCAFSTIMASLINISNNIPSESVFLRIIEIACLIATVCVAIRSQRDTKKMIEEQRITSIFIHTVNLIHEMQKIKINTAVGDTINDEKLKDIVQSDEFFTSRPDMVAALFSINRLLKQLKESKYVDKEVYKRMLADSMNSKYFSCLKQMYGFFDHNEDFFKRFNGVRIKDKNEVIDENDNSEMDISINSDNNFGNIAVVNNGNMDVVNNQK